MKAVRHTAQEDPAGEEAAQPAPGLPLHGPGGQHIAGLLTGEGEAGAGHALALHRQAVEPLCSQ